MRFLFFTNSLSNNYPAKGRAQKKPLFLSLRTIPIHFICHCDSAANCGISRNHKKKILVMKIRKIFAITNIKLCNQNLVA